MKNLVYTFIITAIILSACNSTDNKKEQQQDNENHIKIGLWRASLKINPVNSNLEIPFQLNFVRTGETYAVEIINSEERIKCTEIDIFNDSISIWIPVFDSEIKAKISGDSLIGEWFNYAKGNYTIPFVAEYGVKERFTNKIIEPAGNVEGSWQVKFSPGTINTYAAIGEFKQNNNILTGTFLTETGDYRYLEGLITGDQVMLSCFDGSHAFLFTAELKDGMLKNGMFYSGKHWQEPWEAEQGDANLRDPLTLTYLKDGYENFEFSFPDINGDTVSNRDEKFNEKVLIVQIMGSWCPNCMDESLLLAYIYDEFHEQGLEIVPIAFETTEDMEKVKRNLKRLKEYTGAKYDYLYGGKAEKDSSSAKLPMLNQIMSYPTTIFIDRKGEVRRIHTGFSGPGTGKHYINYVEEMVEFLETLLAE